MQARDDLTRGFPRRKGARCVNEITRATSLLSSFLLTCKIWFTLTRFTTLLSSSVVFLLSYHLFNLIYNPKKEIIKIYFINSISFHHYFFLNKNHAIINLSHPRYRGFDSKNILPNLIFAFWHQIKYHIQIKFTIYPHYYQRKLVRIHERSDLPIVFYHCEYFWSPRPWDVGSAERFTYGKLNLMIAGAINGSYKLSR